MSDNPREPRFAIGLAAELVAAHPQTLRMYERQGLVVPRRTGGNCRLYSESDLVLIQRIQSYTQLGVNLAGIEIIFRLLERVEQLEDELAQRGEPQRRRDDETAIELLRARLRQERSEP